MAEYIYYCEAEKRAKVVPPNAELLTSDPYQVRCACGALHKCYGILGLPWENGPQATSLEWWPVSLSLAGVTLLEPTQA